jgi:hypothetical protein
MSRLDQQVDTSLQIWHGVHGSHLAWERLRFPIHLASL